MWSYDYLAEKNKKKVVNDSNLIENRCKWLTKILCEWKVYVYEIFMIVKETSTEKKKHHLCEKLINSKYKRKIVLSQL